MFKTLDLLQIYPDGVSLQAKRAARFAALITNRLGATCCRRGELDLGDGTAFYEFDETELRPEEVSAWAARSRSNNRTPIIIRASLPGDARTFDFDGVSLISIEMEPWQSETTLFAGSGLADLLGDPERAPLVPAGNYGAHTIGYSAFCALTAMFALENRFGAQDRAVVNGEGVLAWVNWKAALAGALGKTLKREGEQSEWPIIPCKDGDTAFLFTERDWDKVIEMLGDPALKDEKFQTFEGRAKHRDAYMSIIRNWCTARTKAELTTLFEQHQIPSAPVLTVGDLLEDPLLTHRQVFEPHPSGQKLPNLPHRIENRAKGSVAPGQPPQSQDRLPLSGVKVLDFGIITAGAGVSALLADMGADVIKVESTTYPDPFRAWAGALDGDSPFFKGNNRNKKAIALDLKKQEDLSTFLELVKDADVVIENFRRGVLDRLGLTFDRLRAQNPNILLASISGQGLTGPGSKHTTFGSTLEASSGFASLTCYDDGQPYVSGRNLNYPDQIVCLYAAGLIAGQVLQCQQNGEARQVDISQRDCAVFQAGEVIGAVSAGASGRSEDVRERSGRPALSTMLKCEDGVYVAVSCEDLSEAPDVLQSEQTAQNWAQERDSKTCLAELTELGVGAVVCRSGDALAKVESFMGARIYMHSPNGDLVKGTPFQFKDHPMTVTLNSPKVGEHNDQILK